MRSGKNQNVDYILVNLVPHTTTVPSFEKAVEHRKLYSAAGKDKNIKHAWQFKTQMFKKFGSGVYLYFSLIQMLFYTFLIISFVSIPIFLSNFKGNGLNMFGPNSLAKAVMRLSLGNQRQEQYEHVLTDEQVRSDIFVSQTLIIMVDILNTFIFFVFLVFWKIKSDKAVEQLITQDALPSYYTLQVRNLPSNYSQQSIRQHFSKFGGDIAQVSTVYNYQNVLSEVKNLIKLVDDYASSKYKRKAELYELISKQLQKVRNLTKSKTLKPMTSIITFQDIIMRKKIRDLYKYKICPRELRLENKMLKVSNCRVQPSSILWQNYHLQIKTQVRQSILITITLILVLFFALMALFLLNAHGTSMSQKQQAFSNKFDYRQQYTYKEAKQLGTIQAIFIFCSKLTYHNFSLQYYYFCEPYFNSYKQRFLSMIGLSLLVVAINLILNQIICQLANFRRYKTKTEKSRFLILNTFVLNFINSALLMLLIRVQLGGYSLGRLVSSIVNLPADQFSIQPYPDFNRKWYMNIGSQIVMIYAVSLLSSPFIQIIVNWFQAKYRAFKARRAKTQFKMNETLMDSQFDFQSFYSMMLNACFFTLFHSNGIPILYVLAIGAFFALYAASYIVFRYFSCKPVMFDHSLNSVISRVMCLALVMHQLTSLLYFYTEDIFPLDLDHHQSTTGNQDQGSRLLHKLHQGIPFIIIAASLLVFTFNYNRFCRIAKKHFYKYFDYSFEPIKKPKLFNQIFSGAAAETQTVSTEQMIHRTRKSQYLSSYRMQDNPNYLNICYALQILSIFQPYFSSNNSIAGPMASNNPLAETIKMQETLRLRNIMSQEIHEKQSYINNQGTDRPLVQINTNNDFV